MDSSHDSELLQRFISGDHKALFEMFQIMSKPLYILASNITKDKFMSHDIVAESFIKLWRQKKTFRQMNFVEIYLTIIVINACEDFLKEKERKSSTQNMVQFDFVIKPGFN